MDLNDYIDLKVNTKKEFGKIKDIVLSVLESSVRSRNEDMFLILKVLVVLGEDIVVELKDGVPVPVWRMTDLRSIASFETITRCRREVQNGLGLFLPTDPKVLLRRRIRQEAVSEHYR